MQIGYLTLDVFTDVIFGGNPLAVIPDARGLDGEQMRAIAREFNYSETTFVLPPGDPANTARVRIFTPAGEVPFAGHPNVGTAFALARQGTLFDRPVGRTLVFEEHAGPVRCEIIGPQGSPEGARIAAPRPLSLGFEPEPALVAACIGLEAPAVRTGTHLPQVASVGLPFVMAELHNLGQLAAAQPDAAAFARAEAAHAEPDAPFSLMLYVRTGPGRLQARMFAPLHGVTEDPATGSAAAALGAFLARLGPERRFTVAQGIEMGRPSRIHVEIGPNGGASIAGPCVPVMRGTVTI
jgi:trans-2,3-dihydro-3-hydroxyanthranilate isomerase